MGEAVNDGAFRPGEQKAVSTQGLTRRFGDRTVVKRLELSIPYGVIFGLLGPNGAGKTTTIKMLTTMLPPSGGEAWIAGHSILREPVEVRRHLGYVSQMLSADGALTGYENLMLFARIYGIARGERKARVREALDFMGLSDSADAVVRTYSGGMIRRLEIAQSMLHRPAILFLDEPTIGLDPVARQTVWHRLRELRERFGTTILMTTHDMEEADELCETVAIMHEGKIAGIGSPAELKAKIGADATLEDVFVRLVGEITHDATSYRDILQTRRTARRLS